ncbi:MAG: hypothetical protein IJS47_03090 [Clostridia bacterium]|nr:hypothetical protein [Clostridia bacterium]
MKKVLKILAYLCCIILGIFYVVIIYLGINAKNTTSTEYRLFFIEDKLKYYPINDALSYNLGDEIDYSNMNDTSTYLDSLRIGNRSITIEEDGALYIDGENARIFFKGIEKKDLTLELALGQIEDYESINVYINDNEIYKFTQEQDYALYEIKKEYIGDDGLIELKLDSTDKVKLNKIKIY